MPFQMCPQRWCSKTENDDIFVQFTQMEIKMLMEIKNYDDDVEY